MRVRDVMSTPAVVVAPETPVKQAALGFRLIVVVACLPPHPEDSRVPHQAPVQ